MIYMNHYFNVVILNEVKNLILRYFAALRMTRLIVILNEA